MDWAPGDFALCIDEVDFDGTQLGVRKGAIYTVTEVFIGWDGANEGLDLVGLVLAEITPEPEGDGFWASCFVKVTPEEPDEFDYEVICDLIVLPSPVFTEIGGTAPVAAPSPEAANNGSGRGAVVICLGAPALSQTLDDVPRQVAERDWRALSEIPFHSTADSPEAR